MEDLDKKIIELMDLFDDEQVTTADKIDRPERALEKQAIDDFMKRNPQADGGRIGFLSGGDVERIVDIYNAGSEGGYRTSANFIAEQLGKKPGEISKDIVSRKINELIEDGTITKQKELETTKTKGKRKIYKVVRPIETRDRINNPDIPKDAKFKIQLPGSKIQGGKGGSSTTQMVYGKTKKELNEALKKSEKLTKSYVKPKLPKNDPTSPLYEPPFERADKFLVVKTRGPTVDNIKKIKYEEVIGSKNQPNTFKPTGKIVTKYKPFVGPDKVTIPGQGADTLKEAQKFVKDYFKKNPKQIRVRDPKKDYASKEVREKALKETDPTKARGTKKFNYHHIRQIAGGVPLTTDDVMIINQRINSALGTRYNKPLNSISAAIQKNNRLALEAMNAKQEGLALEYMKRSDDLNAQAEKIVNSAIDKLPKKYKGYVGFNQFTLPRDEYGLPISNEPLIVKKVGGMPVSKDAIDLTDLNLKQETEFKKLVRAQAETGKVGQIKGLSAFIKKNFPDGEIICNLSNGINCNNPQAYQKSINQLTQKAKQGDEAARATLTNFTNKAATAGKFIKGALGPLAIASEVAIEGGIALNKTLQTGVPLKTAFADSIFNLALGPKLQIDKEAELAKEFAKGEDFAMAERGRRMMIPQSATADAQRLKKREQQMEQAFPTTSPQKIDEILQTKDITINDLGMTYPQIQDFIKQDQQMQAIADAGGVANLAKGGRAGFKVGSLRKGIQALIDKSVKSTPTDTTPDLDALIKKALDEDFFDKKDRIIDNINLKIDKARAKGLDSKEIGEGQIEFYDDITKSNFRTKTGPFFDRRKRAGGGILKQAGDSSGPPPESGPNPQGLQGLMKRGMKI